MAERAAKSPEKVKRGRPRNLRGEGIGRKKGTPNKATQEIRTITRELTFQNPTYVARIKAGLEKGGLPPAVELYVLESAWGKNKQVLDIAIPENPALAAARAFYESLTPEERRLALGVARRRLALATVVDVIPSGD